MVKELKKRFIKTTMLVVTIMLVVFLVSIFVINYSLTKQDNTNTLNKIINRNLRAIPGVQVSNQGFGANSPGNNAPGENNLNAGSSGEKAREKVPDQPMTEPEIPSNEMGPAAEPEMNGDSLGPAANPEIPQVPQEPMSEAGLKSEEPATVGEDLGRYAIARLNPDGVIVFKNYNHDPSLDFAGLVDLINAANVEFAPKATGESETEEIFNSAPELGEEGEGVYAEEGSVAPPDEGSTPPPDEGNAPPVDNGENGPSNEGLTKVKEVRGTVNGYVYYAVQQSDGSVLYAFLNISEQINSVARLVLITLALGAVLWLLIFLVVNLLSAKAIAPIAENIEKQRQFITDAGHELKTPLAVIVSNVDVQELHSGKTKWLDNIRAQALRLSELTKQMLTLSKMEEVGTTAFMATTFDASKELEDVVQVFRESASLRGIEIRTNIEPRAEIHFSREQYKQMAELLLDNAMKYGKENGFLSVSLHCERKTITLSFKNNCDQLPDIDPDRLFERFYRSDSSRSRQTGGSGIGLAVVRAIAEHGGGYAKAHFLPDEVIEFEIQLQKKN